MMPYIKKLSTFLSFQITSNQVQMCCIFTDMSNLQIMSMKFNAVTSLEDDIIIGFSKLTKLDLRESLLEDRPPHWKVINLIITSSV